MALPKNPLLEFARNSPVVLYGNDLYIVDRPGRAAPEFLRFCSVTYPLRRADALDHLEELYFNQCQENIDEFKLDFAKELLDRKIASLDQGIKELEQQYTDLQAELNKNRLKEFVLMKVIPCWKRQGELDGGFEALLEQTGEPSAAAGSGNLPDESRSASASSDIEVRHIQEMIRGLEERLQSRNVIPASGQSILRTYVVGIDVFILNNYVFSLQGALNANKSIAEFSISINQHAYSAAPYESLEGLELDYSQVLLDKLKLDVLREASANEDSALARLAKLRGTYKDLEQATSAYKGIIDKLRLDEYRDGDIGYVAKGNRVYVYTTVLDEKIWVSVPLIIQNNKIMRENTTSGPPNSFSKACIHDLEFWLNPNVQLPEQAVVDQLRNNAKVIIRQQTGT